MGGIMIGDINPDKLKTLASSSGDPDILMGLVILDGGKSLSLSEVSQRILQGRAGYASTLAVAKVMVDRPEETAIAELIAVDPDNALGHYLQANLLYQAGKDQESLAAFRKGAACPELRLYGNIRADALFKALDALEMEGRERLATSSATATQLSNFYSINLQHLHIDLQEMAHKSDWATQSEIADLLLTVAGHLYATNYPNRDFAEWTVQDAFHIRARIAGEEKSPAANGYLSAADAIFGVKWSLPDLQEEMHLYHAAGHFLPSRISIALSLSDSTRKVFRWPIESAANVPEKDKAAFEMARADAAEAAAALVEAALIEPDEIIGAYLKDVPRAQTNSPTGWVSTQTHVTKLLWRRQDLFRAAVKHERAFNVLQHAGRKTSAERNVGKLMHVGSALWCYARDHNQILPESLEVLYKDGKYLKDAEAAQSLFTGKLYVCAAPGKKMPVKQTERDRFVLAYDDHEEDGECQFVLANGGGSSLGASDLKKILARQAEKAEPPP